MAFGIGINTQETSAGQLKKEKKEIACECWFSKRGNTKPVMIKFEDEEGIIQTVDHIRVLYTEKKNYAGIHTIEYSCIILHNEVRFNVKLLFVQAECKWFMIF